MNLIPVSALSGVSTLPAAVPGPRAVSPESARQFRDLVNTPACGRIDAPCPAETAPSSSALHEVMELSIEKVLMANMPAANASPAEFAVGLLRAQVKVSQTALAIETVSKTTQSLSQGVQSLTARS
jgi:hypothetical protein